MALAPSGPSEERAEPDVSLLLRRTGFGTTGAEVETATRRGYEATVDALLHPGTDPGATATPPPDLSGEPARPPAPDDKDARRAYARQLRSRSAALTLWWLDRMVRVRQPLVERLTFTWHGHWATSHPEGAQPRDDAAAEPDAALARPWRLPRAGPGDGARPGAAGLAGRPEEQEGQAEREPRPRADGAVHARGRALLRDRRARGGPGADRLAGRPDARDGRAACRSSTTTAARPCSA